MRFVRPLALVSASLGVVACTALLGDFSVSSNGPGSGPDGSDGANDAGALAITPDQSKIGVFRAQTFTANQDVTWSIQEGAAAGTIDEKGRFLSGATAGTYHVVATSKSDPSRSATVPVIVVDLAVNVLVGANGGAGNIDGPAKVAHFNAPRGVVGFYDNTINSRRYYVADTENHTIRGYDEKSGNVVTIAGKAGEMGTADGIGDVARFKEPTHLALDTAKKKLYVVDSSDGNGAGTCIRVINLASNQVGTLAGTCGTPGTQSVPKAMFGAVNSIALSGDQTSALYVTDQGRARRVLTSDGSATDMLPNGSYANLLTLDTWNGGFQEKVVYYLAGSTVYKFTEAAAYPVLQGAITQVTTLSNISVDSMVFANYSDLFFANTYESVIYRLELQRSTGTDPVFSSTPWLGTAKDSRVIDGSGETVRLGRPAGLGVIEQGDLLFADMQGHSIRRVRDIRSTPTADTIIGTSHVIDLVDGPRQSARVTGPFAVAADESGMVYFGDINFSGSTQPNSTIRKYDRTNAIASSVSGIPTRPLDPANPPTDGPKGQARFWFPIDMTYAKGSLYVVDNFAQAVRSVDVATGTVGTVAGEKTVAGNNDGIGGAAHFKFATYGSASGGAGFLSGAITTDGTNLYVSDTLNYAIRKIVIATGETTTIAGGVQGNLNGTGKSAQFRYPLGLTWDDGVLYIADYEDHTIRRMNLTTGVVDGFIGLSGTPGSKDGDAATATLSAPFRVRADGLGNLYVAELPLTSSGQPSGIIRRISIKDRKISTFAGTVGSVGLQSGKIPSTLNCPTSMTLMPQHDLVFGDFCEATIGIIQPL